VIDNIVDSLIVAIQSSNADQRGDSVDSLLQVCSMVGLDRSAIEHQLLQLLRERLALHLIGSVQQGLNYRERSRLVDNGLRAFVGDVDEQALKALVQSICKAQSSIAMMDSRRAGLSSTGEVFVSDLLTGQSHRCAVCRVPLTYNVRRNSEYFDDGFEPVHAPTLDHMLPYYLFGNNTSYEILCRPCNLLKNDRIGLHEDGPIMSGNSYRERRDANTRRRTAFWTIYSRRQCEGAGCAGELRTLLVKRKSVRRTVTIDNLVVICTNCVASGAWWLHDAEPLEMREA
jgi:hypothetical protein